MDEQVYDATCIVADTDNWSCEVWNFARRTDSIDRNTCESLSRKPVFASSLVSTMVESTKELWDIDMPSKYVSTISNVFKSKYMPSILVLSFLSYDFRLKAHPSPFFP